jgi:D-glutamate cyclase
MAGVVKCIAEATVNKLQDVIGSDVGSRGMKSLIVPGDLLEACRLLVSPKVESCTTSPCHVLILTGFPCCINHVPPTETDGPAGSIALARASVRLGHCVTLCTDECNRQVLEAAIPRMESWVSSSALTLESFSSSVEKEDTRLRALAKSCDLILACERAGPAADGICYTMRGISMNDYNLIAPLHLLISYSNCPFLAIGDGGNELGMGKVLDKIQSHIPLGSKIGCVVSATYLVAASVSNWGAYAMAAGAAVLMAASISATEDELRTKVQEWVDICLPTEADEILLMERCMSQGCRDGVTGKIEATVDGMPLEVSLSCLREIRKLTCSLQMELSENDGITSDHESSRMG